MSVRGYDRWYKLPIDFIFDEQNGVGEDFLRSFEYMVRNLPRGARKLINGSPIFRDDKAYMPLQAADMLAWHIRREHDDGLPEFGLPMASRLRGEHHISTKVPREALEKWGAFFARQKGVELVQSKAQWRKYRVEAKAALEAGFIPPHGTRWKNLVNSARERLARLLGF